MREISSTVYSQIPPHYPMKHCVPSSTIYLSEKLSLLMGGRGVNMAHTRVKMRCTIPSAYYHIRKDTIAEREGKFICLIL